jgi:hypothetical protein
MNHRTRVVAASSSDIRAVHTRLPVLPWGGSSLPWRIVRFGVALFLIIVAAYWFGGIAGRWIW